MYIYDTLARFNENSPSPLLFQVKKNLHLLHQYIHLHFSKRRTGLFKKASELATLCNAELGIVVFSPGGKPFSYGKPNLDSKVKKMSERLDSLNQEIEAEKEQGEKGQEKLESVEDERFEKSIEKLTLDELNEYMDKLETVHGRIQVQANHMQASSSLMLLSRDN